MRALRGIPAFSLVEVTLAMGVCAFALIALIGLFQIGLQSGRTAEEQVRAANLVSRILNLEAAAPGGGGANAVLSADALTNSFREIHANRLIGRDGRLTNDESAAEYRITCHAGTNSLTGSRTAQIYLALSWPPATTNNPSGNYEVLYYLPLE